LSYFLKINNRQINKYINTVKALGVITSHK